MIIGTLLVVVEVVAAVAPAVLPARVKPEAVEVPCLAALIGDKVGPLIVRTFGSWFTLVMEDVAAPSVLEGVPVPLVGAVLCWPVAPVVVVPVKVEAVVGLAGVEGAPRVGAGLDLTGVLKLLRERPVEPVIVPPRPRPLD